ncbi:MAG TPA: HAD family hydrolase [Anaeromyxobacteraceae bacterium]|nr:HAD family hydrolase [Anaeromyxobacteraceae bacterium]
MTGRRVQVVLWDIDGTLVSAGGAGRRAFERAVADFVGPFDGALREMRLDGMTDRLIVREALTLLGKPHTDALCDDLLGRYVEHLRGEIHGPGFEVLPAAAETLAALRDAGRPFGLCTGNVVDGARVKLAHGGLDGFFEWGEEAIAGFAADGEAREDVVAAALRRATARLGRPVPPGEVLVVGDTPRDVAAAHLHGCPVLGVATGRFTVEELRGAGAEWAVTSLGVPDALPLLLGT